MTNYCSCYGGLSYFSQHETIRISRAQGLGLWGHGFLQPKTQNPLKILASYKLKQLAAVMAEVNTALLELEAVLWGFPILGVPFWGVLFWNGYIILGSIGFPKP